MLREWRLDLPSRNDAFFLLPGQRVEADGGDIVAITNITIIVRLICILNL